MSGRSPRKALSPFSPPSGHAESTVVRLFVLLISFHAMCISLMTVTLSAPSQAAFDQRILSSVCFFATDIHSASLGKGKSDDTLARVKKGDLTGKGELVVSPPSRINSLFLLIIFPPDDFRQTGICTPFLMKRWYTLKPIARRTVMSLVKAATLSGPL